MKIGQLITFWTTKGLAVESSLLYDGRSKDGTPFKVYHYTVTKKLIGNYAEMIVKTNMFNEPTSLIHADVFFDTIGNSGSPDRVFIKNATIGQLEDYV